MPERLSRRRRRRRLWVLAVALAVILAVAVYLVLSMAGCSPPPLDVTITVHNAGPVALVNLSIDQRDGSGHVLVPAVAPGKSVTVRLVSDDAFGESAIDLVDDASGRNYGLPPGYFENALHGSIDIEAKRSAPGADLAGQARCDTDYIGGRQGWTKLAP